VPTIFFFLFPPQLALFLEPERLVGWIEALRARAATRPRPLLLYDGRCGFCLESVARLRVLDLFAQLELLDFRVQVDLKALHPDLTLKRCRSEMVLVEPGGRLTGGFDAFRRLALRLPLLWWAVPLAYLPGAGPVGRAAYRWVAAHRYLLHRNPACSTNSCALEK
jgi:predicted DCC family thiol-disulfide oxidoreductase YuxK